MSTLDQNAIVASVVTNLTKDFLKGFRDKSKGYLSRRYDLIFEDFSEYLTSTHSKCDTVKTIISREKPYRLKEVYVNGNFRCGDEQCDDNALCQFIRDNNRTVVTGFGGIGKTIFAKNLWLSIFNESGGRIPIFLELRRLNSLTTVDLETVLRNTLFPAKRVSREDFFEDLLSEGRFIFIFDAFDELNEDKKGIVEGQVLSLAERYPECGIIVTSRRDHRFDSWEQFHIYRAMPFAKEQVKELIQKIDFDQDIKKKFITQIVEKSFEKHKSFLSTPLLSLMMLMTFSQYGELPEKIHIFYRYAFQALYAWHDASKEAFRRERKSGLLIDQFEKVFSIFCMMTYYDFTVTFDEDEILHYVEKSKKHVEFVVDSRSLVQEEEQAVNLIYKEGMWYNFTHRSFQEYFSAFALANFFPNRISDILNQMTVRPTDSMLQLLYEINPVIVEENFLAKASVENGDKFLQASRIDDPIEFLAFIDFKIYVMASWPTPRKGSRSNPAPTKPHLTTHFGNYKGPRKISEVVCTMFKNKFESEVGELYPDDIYDWIQEFEMSVSALLTGFRLRSASGYRACVYELSSRKLTISDSNGAILSEQYISISDIVGSDDALSKMSISIKRQFVFSDRLTTAIRRRISEKQATLDDIIG